MAVVRCFEDWCPELEGELHPIQVLSDHRNLEYFISTQLLNHQQTRRAEYLLRFNFKIVYCLGKAGGKPDSLIRWSEYLSKGGDERVRHMEQTILKPKNLPKELLCIHTVALSLAGIQ